ncbi:MAG: ATP-binding protein [Cytophagales bacterium]|nr:ATP-binding protein [Cytophagales bacterium]
MNLSEALIQDLAPYWQTVFLEEARECILVIDQEFRVKSCSANSEALFPFLTKDTLFLDYLPPDSQRSFMQAVQLLQLDGKPKNCLLNSVTQNQLQATAHEIGQRLLLQIEDVSEQGKINQAAERSLAINKSLLELSEEGVLILDEAFRIVRTNEACCDIFAYKPSELIEQHVRLLIPEFQKKAQTKSHKGSFKESADITGIKKNEAGVPLRLKFSRIEYCEKKNKWILVFSDVSDKKENENRIKHFKTAYKNTTEEIEEFAYIASHDLQEPLRKVRAFGERMQKNCKDELSPKGMDYLQRMLHSTDRMKKMIESLLKFTRLKPRNLHFQVVNLADLTKQVLEDVGEYIARKGADVELGDLPFVEGEASLLRQLIQNLIINAVKYQPEGQKAEVRMDSITDQVSGFTTIRFRDNGIGFDQENSERIFQLFQRLEGSKFEGSGVGLAICRKIVNFHDGKIFAESKKGHGTTFFVQLPIKQIEA